MKGSAGSFASGALLGAALVASVGAAAQGQPLTPEFAQFLRKVGSAFEAMRQNFAGEASQPKMFDGCLSGMLRGVDPQSDYVNTVEFREIVQGGAGPRGGLGLELAAAANGVRVVAALEGTPAERAGLQTGDVLMRVDGTELGGMGLAEAVRLMRGAPGSQVRITLLRAGALATEELVLERQVIVVREVRSRLVAPGIGYARISQFRDSTPETLARQLNALQKENAAPLRGLVLDLRSNPGGLLHAGIAVAAAFLRDDQKVLRMEGRTPESNKDFFAVPGDFARRGERDFRAELPPSLREVPLVVLVNRGSAAASEIVAGALQDHRRATVVGEKTFGRGSIQTLMPMGDGSALKITTAYWHTPSGRALHGQGVVPDVILDAAALEPVGQLRLGGDADAGLQRARALLERG